MAAGGVGGVDGGQGRLGVIHGDTFFLQMFVFCLLSV